MQIVVLTTGGDVWVLAIKSTKASDSGVYVREVNSDPIVRSFHKLSGMYVDFTLTSHESSLQYKTF